MTEKRIQKVAQLPGYEKNGRVYGGGGLAPTIQARDAKDPPRIAVETSE